MAQNGFLRLQLSLYNVNFKNKFLRVQVSLYNVNFKNKLLRFFIHYVNQKHFYLKDIIYSLRKSEVFLI